MVMFSELPVDTCYALYPYGSRVYGNALVHSDYDYVAVSESFNEGEIKQGLINLKKMSPKHFQQLLDEHRMTALECYFLPEDKVLKGPKRPWHFKLDKELLFTAVKSRSDRDWLKAQKRFAAPYDRENEILKAKKSLFHSIRLIMFGTQILNLGRIADYAEANNSYEEIMTDPAESWVAYESQWSKVRNELLAVFRDSVKTS